MPIIRLLIQLLLCAILIAAGLKGFQLLKEGPSDSGQPVAEANTPSDANASSQSNRVDSNSTSSKPASQGAEDNGQTTPLVENTQKKSEADEAWPVSVLSVSKQKLSPTLAVYGSVETPRQTDLTAGVNADVMQVTVLEGQEVESGTLLVELDATDLNLVIEQRLAEIQELGASAAAQRRRHQANLESLKSERELLALSKRQLERYASLAQRQIGTRAAADDAERSVRQQELAITNRQNAIDDHSTTMASLEARKVRIQAQLRQARRDLGRTRITAPFSGRIISVAASPGNRVRSGEALVSMYDTSLVEVRAQIPNRLLPQIESAIANGIEISGTGQIEGSTITLVLNRLAAMTRSGSGSVDALLRITSRPAPQLGRTIDIRLDMPAVESSFAVPSSAISNNGRVFIVQDAMLKAAQVNVVGELRDAGRGTELLVISDDVRDGDQVVISQIPSAREGLSVQILDR